MTNPTHVSGTIRPLEWSGSIARTPFGIVHLLVDASGDGRATAQRNYESRILAAIHPDQEPPSGWQSIDTAPKDENVLLAWLYEPTGVWVYQAGLASSSKGGWWHGQATHWMPLPEPPK